MSFAPFGPDQTDSTLSEVLLAREERAARQRALQMLYGSHLISFTLNIPGPVKNSMHYRRAHDLGWRALLHMLQQSNQIVLHNEVRESAAGREAFLAVEGNAILLKQLCVQLEDTHPMGRLFDFDVLRPDGLAIHRAEIAMPPRRCLICAEPAHACARSRRHSLAELLLAVEGLLD